MAQKVLEWQHRAYHDYSEQELLHMNYGIWDWNRSMWHDIACMNDDVGHMAEIPYYDGALHVFYIEHDGRIFLPGKNMDTSNLPELTEEILLVAIMADTVYELKGDIKEWFVDAIKLEPDENLEMSEYYQRWLQELKQKSV